MPTPLHARTLNKNEGMKYLENNTNTIYEYKTTHTNKILYLL